MGDVFIWRYFNQLVTRRFVWGEEPDRELVAKTLAEDVPQVLDYLETLAPAGDGFIFEALSIADVSIACFLRNASFARFSVDPARWPRTAALYDRVIAKPSFQALQPFESCVLSTPMAEAREALAKIGAPITKETYGTTTPRRGVMPV